MALPQSQVRAWHPSVTGISEVLHAYFPDHAYPLHVHDTWTLLIVDDGVVTYDLAGRDHATRDGTLTILPPHVPHDGRPATPGGFRKRVVYLDEGALAPELIGRAADRPTVRDPVLRRRVGELHPVLASPGDGLEAHSRLALIVERLTARLSRFGPPVSSPRPRLAGELRELIDARVVDGIRLDVAARLLRAHPTQLVRAFSREYGVPPHQYLVGRRVDLARHLLLGGMAAADVAVAAGFHDQPHLSRHFRRVLGVTPGAFVTGIRGGP